MDSVDMKEYFFEATEYCFQNSDFDSQKALAITAGIPPSMVNEILKRKKSFGSKTQAKIASAFSYDIVDFMALGRDLLNGEFPLTIELNKVSELFRKALKLRLLEKGSHSYLADACQIHRSNMNDFITGQRNLSNKELNKISGFFAKTFLEMLFEGQEVIDREKGVDDNALFIKALTYYLESQRVLSDYCKITRSDMDEYIMGRRKFSEEELYLISECFGITYLQMLDIGRMVSMEINIESIIEYQGLKTSDDEAYIKALNSFFSKKKNQTTLAKYLKITPSNLNVFLKGHRNFSDEEKGKIAEYFGSTYAEMIIIGLELQSREENVIRKFKQKLLAKECNEIMIELEALDLDELQEVKDYLEFRLEKRKKSRLI
ncbi:MAG: hypothetical protein GY760_23500 [Deltaproteobacteria bacterium]|nr:hypothetical protein [Deltaproteobacteria bacterium]